MNDCPTCGRPRCPQCDQPVARADSTYCSLKCSNDARRQHTHDLAEDVAFLIDAGAGADEIARRLGKSGEALWRSMQRIGRHDLAAHFSYERDRNRRHPCVDCGDEVSAYAQRCVRCANARKRLVAS